MNNLISIIIPVFNGEIYIKRAIDSVLAQTYYNFEIIIVNDGSIDKTEDIIKKYLDNNKIRYFKHEENSGTAAAPKNTGISKAQGEFIAFLDSDDYWEKEKLEKQIKLFSNKKTGLVFSDGKFIGENKKKSGKLFSDFLNFHKDNVFKKLILSNFIPSSSVIIRKEVLEKTGNFIVDKRLKVSEDYDLWLKIAKDYEIDFISENLFSYTTSPDSLSGNKKTGYKCMLYLYKQWLKKKITIYEKILFIFSYIKTILKIIIINIIK